MTFARRAAMLILPCLALVAASCAESDGLPPPDGQYGDEWPGPCTHREQEELSLPCGMGSSGWECVQITDDTTAWMCPDPGTPLVLVFDARPVDYTIDAAHAFDLHGGVSTVTDWPTARTPWLALDRDGDGAINDGGELFGSLTVLPDGQRARDGFEALRALDANHDGQLTAEDEAFAKIRVWADADGDRRSTARELRSLADLGVVSLDLHDHVRTLCDARGNCERERAPFTYRDAAGVLRAGEIVDVHIARQQIPASSAQ